MFRQFRLGPGHVGHEEPPNILQSFLNEFLNLPEPCVEPAAVSREEFFADRVEFPLALPNSSSSAVDRCPSAIARARFAISVFSFSRLFRIVPTENIVRPERL